jgi:hypothetical protein
MIMIFDSATVLFIIIGILLMIGNFALIRWGMTFLSRKLEFRNDMKFYITEDE